MLKNEKKVPFLSVFAYKRNLAENDPFLPFSVFLVLAIFLFDRVQIVSVGVDPYKKIAWLHGR